jgi:hypothetical protein
MFQRGHENLAVPDLSGANGGLDHSHRLFDLVAGDRDLQADSGQEIQDRFGSREELGTPWSTEALYFRDGYSSDVKRRQGPADLVNLEVLDERGDNFHCWHPLIAGILHLLVSPVPKSSRITCLLAQFNPAVRCRSRSPRASDEVSDPPRYRKVVEFPGNCS